MRAFIIALSILGAASVAFAQTDGATMTENDYQARRVRTQRVNIVDGIKTAPTTTTDFGAKGFVDLTETAAPDLVQAP